MLSPTNIKFGRNYSLSVQTRQQQLITIGGGGLLTIEPPFTIEFDITRNTFSSTNVAQIRIFNLSQYNRNLIRKNVMDLGDLRTITLQAGYGKLLPVVFSGNITQAWSVREGTNFITQIESFDGGFAFANSTTNAQFPAETPFPTVLETIMGDLQGVSFGAVGPFFDGPIGARGNSYSGNTAQLLTDLTNGQFFVDNGKSYCLDQSECIEGQIQLIDSAAGLLGTPLREYSFITFDILFEPRVICGQLVNLVSSTDVNFNGQYKVVAVKHRGMISPAACGELVTSLTLDASSQTLSVVT